MIVLDASAWIDVLTAGVDVPALATDDIVVPPHFDVEVIGSIRALQQQGVIDPAAADKAVDRHLRGVFERSYEHADIRQAWALRDSMSFRDAWYVGLAQRLDALWVTADREAARTARRLDVTVQVV